MLRTNFYQAGVEGEVQRLCVFFKLTFINPSCAIAKTEIEGSFTPLGEGIHMRGGKGRSAVRFAGQDRMEFPLPKSWPSKGANCQKTRLLFPLSKRRSSPKQLKKNASRREVQADGNSFVHTFISGLPRHTGIT